MKTPTTSLDQSIETGKCQYSSPYSGTCNRSVEVLVMDEILMDETLVIGRCRKHTAGYVVIANA